MKAIICKRCNVKVQWDGQSEIVTCPYCGTKYRVRPKASAEGADSGAVIDILTSQGAYAGKALARGFVPKGWEVTTNAPEQESSIFSPLPIIVNFVSPKEDALITFTGTRIFQHIDPTPQNDPRQGQMARPERYITLTYQDAEFVCNRSLSQNPTISDVRVLSSSDQPDPWARNHMQKMMQAAVQGGMLSPGGNWVKKYVTCLDANGEIWHKLMEVMVVYSFQPVSQTEQMIYQMALQSEQRKMALINNLAMHGYVAGMMAGMATPKVQPPRPKLRWALQYMVETSAKEEAFREAADFHDKIRNSVAYTPFHEREARQTQDAMHRQSQQEQAQINEIVGQMNRDQQESWKRKQQIIKETNDYTTNIMREVNKNAADSRHRINNRWSEVIRDVNTYYTKNPGYGEPRVVEVSNKFDHVYQNTRYPGHFAASTGDAPVNFGVDYEELERTNGDY